MQTTSTTIRKHMFGIALLALAGPALSQVADDSACARHGADIAGFATCDGDRLARPAPEMRRISPREAAALKHARGPGVLLIDIRRPEEIERTGVAEGTDAVVVYAEQRIKSRADDADFAWIVAPAFIAEVDARVHRLGLGSNATLLLLSRDGTSAERAARALHALGYTGATVIEGGVGGVLQGSQAQSSVRHVTAGLRLRRDVDLAALRDND